MTELATTSPAGIAPVTLPNTTGTVQLQEWAAELSAAHALGTALCGTDFVPKDFRGKPDAAAAAILAGKSLGLDPMNALSNIFVVHGRPALYARTMVALVMAQGHEVIRTNATPDSVTEQARRKGSERWQEFTWTLQRAQQAGYTGNAKYKTNPIEMLYAKAAAEACRVIAPDVLTGVAAYSVEEVELENLGEQPAPPVKTKITRKRAEAPAPELPTAVQDAPEPEAEPFADIETGEVLDEDMASKEQVDALVTALQAAGHTTPAKMRAAIADQIGETKSATELTAFEADTLTQYFNTTQEA